MGREGRKGSPLRAAARRLAAVAVLAAALAAPAGAHAAGIGTHGPVTEAFGRFPEWYEDAAGTRLELCLEGPHCLAPAIAPPPHPDQPVSFPDNFPAEAFWWDAETTLAYPGGAAELVLAQEAAFLGGPVADGDQVAFGRLRIRATGLVPGAWYRFTHPFGQLDLQAVDGAPRVVNHTEDVGCLAPPCGDGAFSTLAGSAIGPEFLQWDTTESAPPAGFIGDPAIPHTITGSRFVPAGEAAPANYFRVERISGPGGAVLESLGQTGTFTLQGKLAGPPRGHFAAADARFGALQLGSSARRTVTIRNTGSGDLALGATALGGPGAADFALVGSDCPVDGALAPAQACTAVVDFRPSATGDRRAQLQMSADGVARTVALTGTGTFTPPPAALASAAPVVVVVPGPSGTASPARRAVVRRLAISPVIGRKRVLARGLRLVFRISGDAEVVRVRIFRMRGARRGARVAQVFRSPTTDPTRLRLADRSLRRRLTPGSYLVEVAAGTTRTTLGATVAQEIRVAR